MNKYTVATLIAIQLAAANGHTEVAYDLMFQDPDIVREMDKHDLAAPEMLDRILRKA